MKQVTARIGQGENTIVDGVTVWFQEQTSNSGLHSWNGYFEIENLPQEFFDNQGPYDIEMSDGRAGQFLIQNTELMSVPVTVFIVSTGPLA
jgi:hypothetical protein